MTSLNINEEVMSTLKQEWHLDRRITISLIVAILMNAGSFIWWASKMDYTITSHEVRIVKNGKKIEKMREQEIVLFQRLSRIEANQENQTETLKEIRDYIKRSR